MAFYIEGQDGASEPNALPWCCSSWAPSDISCSLAVWIRNSSSSFANMPCAANRAVGSADFSVSLVNKQKSEENKLAQTKESVFPKVVCRTATAKKMSQTQNKETYWAHWESIHSSFSLFFSKKENNVRFQNNKVVVLKDEAERLLANMSEQKNCSTFRSEREGQLEGETYP